jgi:hypothetical protein
VLAAHALREGICHVVFRHPQGFVLSFRPVAVSVNGSFMVGEYTPNADSSGLDCKTNGQKVVGAGYRLPINIMLVDSRGEAARMVIAQDGARKLLH